MPDDTRIIGLDQSYTCTGLAVAYGPSFIIWGRLKFKAKMSKAEKRKELRIWLASQAMLDVPGLMVIESLWTLPGSSISAALIDVAFAFNMEVRAINPRSWKKRLLGDSNAPKSESIKFASNLIRRELEDDNVADAICIAHAAHLHPDLLKKAE